MNIIKSYLFFLLFCTVAYVSNAQNLQANAVYQYAVKVEERTAYLWIPPKCNYIRGVIFAAENALERQWMESAIIRKTAADEHLAMIWLADGTPSSITYEITPQAAIVLDTMFVNLASVSGYHELAHAPVIVTGHSWNGRQTWNYANQRPDRVIAAIPIRTYPMPDTLNFSGIPMLYIVGQTTELPQFSDGQPGDRDFFWPIVRRSALNLRQRNENNLICVAVNPGGCHMDWTDDQSQFLALFIKKACFYRLPHQQPVDGKVALKKIDKSLGWLTDTGNLEADHFAPAPYQQYQGDKKQAYWMFDQEMALATINFNGDRKQRKKQMITFIQQNTVVPVQKNGSVILKWLPDTDGVSFSVQGDFLNEVPKGLIDSGKSLGHGNLAIKYYSVLGDVQQVDKNRFRIAFDRQAPRNPTIMADQPADMQYRRATQPGRFLIPAVLKQGSLQHITFPNINDQKVGVKTLKLGAVATSGRPVQYYVKYGPAYINGNNLIFTDIPVKSKFPIKVEVVACQWGSLTAPFIQTAEQKTQVFYITN